MFTNITNLWFVFIRSIRGHSLLVSYFQAFTINPVPVL